MPDAYTIDVRNELTGFRKYEGTFASYGEAEARAKERAARSRSFATYQVCQGTPKHAGKEVGPMFRGSQ